MSGAPGPAPRWGPLHPQTWPQDEHHVPATPGMPMPPVSKANADRAIRESFTMSGSWAITPPNSAGQQYPLYLPTDPDGDFWVDQIYMCAWTNANPQQYRPPPSLISIADARTGISLTYPQSVPVNFLSSLQLFSEDPGFDLSTAPLPDAFRSTGTLPQPFCFTRAGGISLVFTTVSTLIPGLNYTVDIAFSGWKEYAFAAA